ncbi:restriction endonuclease subunit S [Haemophilus sp. HMSC061E01]|jgi:putative type I restriction enzyme ecoR124II specificity protein|uniref:restriction endonuclease subunit S n=1 Tax=Haemophilus sp. HMSC061E01 TaxID=1715211 RepID=UPI0008A34BA8|nr:restriction endonuclease subunit S [Haemophilus sp. HMSC061E01]OFL96481.1 restriction endonuclease subunit S [Haemophilus sp. HMSC061E01]
MKNNCTFLEKLLDGAEVEWKPLNKIVTTITAPVKLKREMYCSTGSTPIIDQGEKFIAGYTDENFEAIPSNEYIIFGDHSEHIKYVNFSFIQGADGLKILKPKEDNAKYIYYAFQNFYVKELNYKRHWSSAKETLIPLPPPTVQTKIVRILDALTALTSELTSELILRQKQYEYYREKLLSEEELGKVGFEWKTLDQISENLDSKRKPITSGLRTSGKIPYYGASGIVDYVEDYIFDGDFLLISEDGANLLARNTPIAFSASGKIWVNNHAHILKFETYEERRFIEFYLNKIDLTPYISGAAQPKLNKKNLNSIKFPIPSIPEQQRIVSILDKFETLTNSITEGLPLAIEQSHKRYEYYRELLLNFPGRE